MPARGRDNAGDKLLPLLLAALGENPVHLSRQAAQRGLYIGHLMQPQQCPPTGQNTGALAASRCPSTCLASSIATNPNPAPAANAASIWSQWRPVKILTNSVCCHDISTVIFTTLSSAHQNKLIRVQS